MQHPDIQKMRANHFVVNKANRFTSLPTTAFHLNKYQVRMGCYAELIIIAITVGYNWRKIKQAFDVHYTPGNAFKHKVNWA